MSLRAGLRIHPGRTYLFFSILFDINKFFRESTRLYELAAKKEELIHQQRMNLIKLNAKIKKQTLQLEQQKDQVNTYHNISERKRLIFMRSI